MKNIIKKFITTITATNTPTATEAVVNTPEPTPVAAPRTTTISVAGNANDKPVNSVVLSEKAQAFVRMLDEVPEAGSITAFNYRGIADFLNELEDILTSLAPEEREAIDSSRLEDAMCKMYSIDASIPDEDDLYNEDGSFECAYSCLVCPHANVCYADDDEPNPDDIAYAEAVRRGEEPPFEDVFDEDGFTTVFEEEID